MDKNYTPAPWIALGLEVGTEPTMFIKTARVSGGNYEEAKANAKLIAAAPELLEALQLFTNSFYKSDMKFGSQEIAFDKAVAAIKKATL